MIQIWSTQAGAGYNPELATDHYLSVAEGVTVDVSRTFLETYASISHLVALAEAGKFVPGETGFIGERFQKVENGDYYGWFRLTFAAGTTNGRIVDWAYEDTAGTGIRAGAVPEASTGLLFGGAALAMACRRRRKSS